MRKLTDDDYYAIGQKFHLSSTLVEAIVSELALLAQPPAQAPAIDAKPKRSTWATDGGWKCLHCDKSIIDHEGQIYCPAPEHPARALSDADINEINEHLDAALAARIRALLSQASETDNAK